MSDPGEVAVPPASKAGGTAEMLVIARTYDLLLWSLPQIAKIPRIHRFTLGGRMENLVFDILENLLEAKYAKEKLRPLERVNIALEKLRFLVRVCKDFKYLNIRRYEYLSGRINEVGRLTGGWLRHHTGTGRE
jgi:hypothetical protein